MTVKSQNYGNLANFYPRCQRFTARGFVSKEDRKRKVGYVVALAAVLP